MKHIHVSIILLMINGFLHAADIQDSVSEVCTQQGDAQSNEKPICDSLNRFTVNCLKTTGGVTVGTFLTVVDGPVQIESFTSGVLQSNSLGVISSTKGANGQLLISGGDTPPIWANITSSDSSVLITNGVNSIDLQAAGGGSGDVVGPVSSTQNAVVLFANTTGKLIQQSQAPVTIDATTNDMANVNNMNIRANYNMPVTTSGGTAGVITVSSSPSIPLMHILGAPGRGGSTPSCVFAGCGAGSITASVGLDNAGFGSFALQNIANGDDNTALGYKSLSNCIDGSNNIALGSGAGRALIDGNSSIYIGADAATSSETGVIRIGTSYHSALFIGGVNAIVSGSSPLGSRVVVTNSSTNQVGINSATPVSIDTSSNVTNVNTLTFIGGDTSLDNPFFGSINLPATAPTTGGVTPGVITQGNSFLLHTGSPDGSDIYVGQGAGNIPVLVGLENSAVGSGALFSIVSGMNNSALGFSSLGSVTSGNNNSAVGWNSLPRITDGTDNSAFGYQALENCTGSNNIALGSGAGRTLVNGNSCIYIGADAPSDESGIIRIGTAPTQSACFIAGIRGVTTGQANAINVLVDSNGQLGTASSSARYKKDIKTMEDITALLMKLRPVRFRYKIHGDQVAPEYGLIAEEVARVAPDLVIYKDGEPESVKYHLLPALLIKALQEVIAKNEEQDAEIAAYKKEFALLLKRIELLEHQT